MALSFTGKKRLRKYFGHMVEVAEMPNLIEVQRHSYDQFLQVEKPEDGRLDEGLQTVFKSVFPISEFSKRRFLEYVDYHFEDPKYDVEECQQRSMTYAAPLKVTLRLIVFDVDQETGAKSVKDIKEQDVYMGDVPFMTRNGTFVVNGTERVIVSQMHRSPGVFFDHDKGKTHSSGKLLFAARVIPYRGSWLDFEFDAKDIIHVRIDRRRKLPATTLLYALGLTQEEILDYFYSQDPSSAQGRRLDHAGRTGLDAQRQAESDWTNAKTGEVAGRSRRQKITVRGLRKLAGRRHQAVAMPDEELVGRYSRARHGQSGNRRDLCRGRRRADDGQPRDAAWKRASTRSTSSMSIGINIGAYIRNTHGGGQEPQPRAGADRHLSRHAPRRAADARHRRDSVRPAVLR